MLPLFETVLFRLTGLPAYYKSFSLDGQQTLEQAGCQARQSSDQSNEVCDEAGAAGCQFSIVGRPYRAADVGRRNCC